MIKYSIIICYILLCCCGSCKKKQTLFTRLSPQRTGIDFSNAIPENDSINILDLENIYNGGGVGIADFNNDGLMDIYFTGNDVPNKLYINKGDFHFNDVTQVSGTAGEGRWCRGVSVVDINNDGLPDIYFTASSHGGNKLYLNKGNFEFEDITDKAGVAGTADWCTGATMAGVKGDGLMDIYVFAVQGEHQLKGRNELFINNGNNTSTESSEK